MNLWLKRTIGVAALGGGLLAFGAGAASAQETSAEASARIGPSAQVRVCSDGRVLSRLLGSCSQDGSGGSVQASRTSDRSAGIRAHALVPRASADVSVGARRNRPQTTGSSPFTLAGDPAADSLLPSGSLTQAGPSQALDLLTGSALAAAGIGVVGSGPIASGNQAGAEVGDVSPSVPVTVCGNGVGVLGDASAACGASQQATTAGSTGTGGGASTGTGTSAGTGASSGGSLFDGAASGNQVDAGIGSVSPSVPVTVCGNGVGVLGDASAACGANQDTSTDGTTASSPGPTGTTGITGTTGMQAQIGSNDITGITGTPAQIGTPAQTGTTGTTGTPAQTGTPVQTGTTGTTGLTPGASGDPAGAIPAFAPLRPLVSAGRALAFTGAAGDLLGTMAVALLAAGALFLRAARPAAVREGGGR